MHVVLILNPAAGGSSRNPVELSALLAQCAGHTLTVVATAAPEEATTAAQRAVAEGVDRVLVAGGDGTINAVVNGLAGSSIPLGIIPIGTVNVLARELGLPLDPLKALEIALHGQRRQMDLGIANGHYFTLMAGMGFDAAVINEILPRVKETFGSLAYITTGLQVLTHYKPSQFTLTLNGDSVQVPAWMVVVGNASYYAYELSMAPDAHMDDGKLDIIVFTEQTMLDRLTQIGAVFIGQHTNHPNVWTFQTSQITISSAPPVALQLDGDAAGNTPVEFSVLPRGLCVMVEGQTD